MVAMVTKVMAVMVALMVIVAIVVMIVMIQRTALMPLGTKVERKVAIMVTMAMMMNATGTSWSAINSIS